MRIFGMVMFALQLAITSFTLPIWVILGPIAWFFWWVAFITWIICILAGKRAP